MIGEADTRLSAAQDWSYSAGHLSGTERLLGESVERGLKQRRDMVVLILHLSRLVAPAPRPHHIRIARVLLQDTATRHGGQVFAMRNQDLVLLAQRGLGQGGMSASDSDSLVVHAPEVLPETLGRLFSADVEAETRLTSLYDMETIRVMLPGYLADCAAVSALASPAVQRHDAVLSLVALQTILDHAPPNELLVLRTGVRLLADRRLSLAERLRPAFRSIQFSFSPLNLSPLVSQAISDPFLFRYLASRLHDRLICLLAEDVGSGGPLTRSAVLTGMPVHVELGISAVLSPEYARLARQAANVGLRFGVAMPLMQVSMDLDRLDEAKRVLAMTGGELIITQCQPSEASLINPMSLHPGLVKLTWSKNRIEGGTAAGADRLPQLDPSRTVLQGADCQNAVAWGQARGLVFYEGAFIDQVQAAQRMAGCEHAGSCTLGRCCDRARAAGKLGRTGCRSIALLDASGAPPRALEHTA